ncbi:MAG: tRNA guanosine(15) transglycosylase TgtA [Thaumarchaeota archaeon]|nr:tRNA guanosine(15) transglycosylase TgtA [Nitrososphaerota archaeon]
MSFSFEVKESDLLGRIGTLKVGGKALETPYMFPVIHPVSQIVPTRELASMGFGGLMTNSYIIHSRRKQEALDRGIHRLLDFDGVFMTDSGGYQVLEYGDLELGYDQVARFQSAIGSDLAVTLDRPTGYPQTRANALDTVEYSLKNAKATLKEFGEKRTVWVGPVQGGVYADLVRMSAKSMVGAGFEVLALGSPVQVMENYMFAELVKMIVAAKRAIPHSVPLHLFGAGHPLTMSLAVALGCDTFDSASYVIFARSGRFMSRGGVMTLKSMKYLPCSCAVCAKTSVKELMELGHDERTKRLSIHNLYVLREELEACKEAISEGRLWDLVEERSMAHPRLREAFSEMSKHSRELGPGTPALKERGLFVRSREDLERPELASAGARLAGSVRRSSKTAVLAAGNVSGQRSAKGADVYIHHPLLGPYPAELDFVYPFSQTEAWLPEQASSIEDSKKKLKALGYSKVKVVHDRRARSRNVRSRRTRSGASPSPPSSSARSR